MRGSVRGNTPQNSTPGAKAVCRVLEINHLLSMGGGETWLMALLRHFKECENELAVKVEVDVVLTSGKRSLFDAEAQALGARLLYLPYSQRRLAQFTGKLRKILDRKSVV